MDTEDFKDELNNFRNWINFKNSADPMTDKEFEEFVLFIINKYKVFNPVFYTFFEYRGLKKADACSAVIVKMIQDGKVKLGKRGLINVH